MKEVDERFEEMSYSITNIIAKTLTHWGWTHLQFVKMMGLSHEKGTKWFGGSYNFDLIEISKIEACLGIDIIYTIYDFNSVPNRKKK